MVTLKVSSLRRFVGRRDRYVGERLVCWREVICLQVGWLVRPSDVKAHKSLRSFFDGCLNVT